MMPSDLFIILYSIFCLSSRGCCITSACSCSSAVVSRRCCTTSSSCLLSFNIFYDHPALGCVKLRCITSHCAFTICYRVKHLSVGHGGKAHQVLGCCGI